jgi:Protein of unknown function, DUF547
MILSPFDHEHLQWTKLLDRYIAEGFVDYAEWGRTGQESLNAYLAALSDVTAQDYSGWSEDQMLAYWVNAYNAFTIRLILDNFPLKSIRSIGILPGAAFRKPFIASPGLRGRVLSLNDLEHKILRKEFAEPRIHFAIVCASISCPFLRSEAYVGARLNDQLDDAAHGFLADASKNRLDAEKRTLYLSYIFLWFRGDFKKSAGSVRRFVTRYLPQQGAEANDLDSLKVRYLRYDWSLNGRSL